MVAMIAGPATGRGGGDEVEQGHVGRPAAGPEHRDRDDLQGDVADADGDDGDRGRERDGAPRIAELGGDVGHGLPSRERPDEQRDRDADPGPAVRQQRLEVGGSAAGSASTTTTHDDDDERRR